MVEYSSELSRNYSDKRESFTATDLSVFAKLNQIGISGKRVLDYGCGDGRYSEKILEKGAEYIAGFDISSGMIEIAKKKVLNTNPKNIYLVQADGGSLPFASNSFDIVFSNFVIHHFKSTNRPFREISNVLSAGGFFIGTFNTADVNDPNIYNSEIPLLLGEKYPVSVKNFIKSDEEIKDSLMQANLKIYEYYEAPNPFLTVDPQYVNRKKIDKIKTIICIAQKT